MQYLTNNLLFRRGNRRKDHLINVEIAIRSIYFNYFKGSNNYFEPFVIACSSCNCKKKKMKSKVLRNVAGLFVLLILVSVLSSCNRGVGCPSAFSAISDVATLIK